MYLYTHLTVLLLPKWKHIRKQNVLTVQIGFLFTTNRDGVSPTGVCAQPGAVPCRASPVCGRECQVQVRSVSLWDIRKRPLTGVAQLVGHRATKWKVTGSVPSQGTCLGYGFSPQLGCLREAANRCFSLDLSLPFSFLLFSLKINK